MLVPMPLLELAQVALSQVPPDGGHLNELLQYGDLGMNGALVFALWKLWGLYREQQQAMAAIMKRLVDHATGSDRNDQGG